MTELQVTLARSSSLISGEALDIPRSATIRFHPAPPDTGFVFVRTDLPGAPEVACLPENVQDQPRWTSLAVGDVCVHHTEHVLAAAMGLGLDNLRMELTSDRVPVTDGGSAGSFVEALATAGRLPQGEVREVYRMRESLVVQAPLDGGRSIRAVSDTRVRALVCVPSDRFGAQYVFQALQGRRELVGTAEWDGTPESFVGPLSGARSYYLESETEQIRGLLNPLLNRFVKLGPRSSQRLVTEAARHKLVDFLGDLAMLGRRIQGRFVAIRSGHALHRDLVRKLVAVGLLERVRLE